MPVKLFQFILLSTTFLFLTGCVSFIDATTSEPIKHDPGKRSLGTYVDDKKINTAIKVNLRKAGPGLEQANINVHTFNAIVLLTGEVPSIELRNQAGKIANESHLVRQVHNELLVQGKPNRVFDSERQVALHQSSNAICYQQKSRCQPGESHCRESDCLYYGTLIQRGNDDNNRNSREYCGGRKSCESD